jgi:hypothetical protein
MITSLEDENGNAKQGHEEKEKLLWEAYNQRLGTTEFTHMYFDLHSLLSATENLDFLEEPFTKKK